MNIGYSEDKNDATHTVCVNNEEIKAVGKLELLGVILGHPNKMFRFPSPSLS